MFYDFTERGKMKNDFSNINLGNVYSQATLDTTEFFKSASLFIVHGSSKVLHRSLA